MCIQRNRSRGKHRKIVDFSLSTTPQGRGVVRRSGNFSKTPEERGKNKSTGINFRRKVNLFCYSASLVVTRVVLRAVPRRQPRADLSNNDADPWGRVGVALIFFPFISFLLSSLILYFFLSFFLFRLFPRNLFPFPRKPISFFTRPVYRYFLLISSLPNRPPPHVSLLFRRPMLTFRAINFLY